MSRIASIGSPLVMAAAQAVHDLQHHYADPGEPPCDMCVEEVDVMLAAISKAGFTISKGDLR